MLSCLSVSPRRARESCQRTSLFALPASGLPERTSPMAPEVDPHEGDGAPRSAVRNGVASEDARAPRGAPISGRFFGRRAALSLGCGSLFLRYRASPYLSAKENRRTVPSGSQAPARLHCASCPEGDSAKNKSSACSRQGLVVDPGGAPAPPECSDAKGTRGRRAPSRFTTPREAPLKWTRWCRV